MGVPTTSLKKQPVLEEIIVYVNIQYNKTEAVV